MEFLFDEDTNTTTVVLCGGLFFLGMEGPWLPLAGSEPGLFDVKSGDIIPWATR